MRTTRLIEEIEKGLQARRVVPYDQWKRIDKAEAWGGAELAKDRERMGWEEAHELLTSAGTWHSWR